MASTLLKVEYYTDYFFGNPTPGIRLPDSVTIAVIDPLTPSNAAHLGRLKAISPEEPRHALVFAIARDIAKGMSDDDLLPWRVLATSAILTFKKVATEDEIFWSATNARETIGAQYESVYYSTVPSRVSQRCIHT
jgi:hypothetical protein